MPLYIAIIYCLVREHDFRPLLFIVGALALCVLLADQVSSGIIKPLVARYRPTHEPNVMHLIDTVGGYRGGRYGFCSSHAANTAAIATYLSLLFRHRATSITLTVWVIINCWTRLYLGVHYAGDICAGLLLGIAIGILIYALLRYIMKRSFGTPMPGSNNHISSSTNSLTTNNKPLSSNNEPPSCSDKPLSLHYSPTRLSVITNVFLLELVVVTFPWRLCF